MWIERADGARRVSWNDGAARRAGITAVREVDLFGAATGDSSPPCSLPLQQ